MKEIEDLIKVYEQKINFLDKILNSEHKHLEDSLKKEANSDWIYHHAKKYEEYRKEKEYYLEFIANLICLKREIGRLYFEE